jgi:hypothetical protein
MIRAIATPTASRSAPTAAPRASCLDLRAGRRAGFVETALTALAVVTSGSASVSGGTAAGLAGAFALVGRLAGAFAVPVRFAGAFDVPARLAGAFDAPDRFGVLFLVPAAALVDFAGDFFGAAFLAPVDLVVRAFDRRGGFRSNAIATYTLLGCTGQMRRHGFRLGPPPSAPGW